MNKHNHKPAFTIIEVVLVLAIAGLIFLMVFIALPALQRNQRDTQRRNDMSRVASALESYKTNNRGQIPSIQYIGANSTNSSDFINNYLRPDGEEFNDPAGYAYRMRALNNRPVGNFGETILNTVASETRGVVYISPNRRCEEGMLYQASPSQIAIQYVMESGGIYCLNI